MALIRKAWPTKSAQGPATASLGRLFTNFFRRKLLVGRSKNWKLRMATTKHATIAIDAAATVAGVRNRSEIIFLSMSSTT